MDDVAKNHQSNVTVLHPKKCNISGEVTEQNAFDDQDFWKRLCKLQTYSFLNVDGRVKRVADTTGGYLDRHEVQTLVDDMQSEINDLRDKLDSSSV